jgi:uncharacterized protein (TIGR03000 family)
MAYSWLPRWSRGLARRAPGAAPSRVAPAAVEAGPASVHAGERRTAVFTSSGAKKEKKMTSPFTKALAATAAVVVLAWVGPHLAQAKDWPGPYDIDGGRYYAEEERDYARWGLGTGGAARGYSAGGISFPSSPYAAYVPSYPYAAYVPNYRYAAERSDDYYGANSEPARDNAARVRLIVPAGAQVWFDDKPTRQTGSVRDFESPQLTPGKDYSYAIQARWSENGKEVRRTHQVAVSAGSSATVDFTRP